jgi:protein Tex
LVLIVVDIAFVLAQEFSVSQSQIDNVLAMLSEGATIPFMARYRKERTGSLDEVVLRAIVDRFTYLTELEKRKETVLESIASQGKLTDELRKQVTDCLDKTVLEDVYAPYKPKRRTKATIAKEKGLESLAQWIESHNQSQTPQISLEAEAAKYLNPEKEVNTVEDALGGAADIIAEQIADTAEIRAYLRDYLLKNGVFTSQIKKEHPEGSTKYEMYRNYQYAVKKIPPHNILALYRGEAEKILSIDIEFDTNTVLSELEYRIVKSKSAAIRQFYRATITDAFNRLLKPSLIREIRSDRKEYADLESIRTFEANLRNLLLASPAGMKATMAIDPGFRTGCKIAILDETGKFMEYQAIFPHSGMSKQEEAAKIVQQLIEKYQIELIAIGNGTASRETDSFITGIIKNLETKPIKVIVNESGASIYSASDLARAEFPDLDITVRGAISIGRRLQDPLAELVKIDPKSIGVGQYQHDVEQKLLQQKLAETVESCVNYVGVDLNTASAELLKFVSGITPTIANNIVSYRNEKGKFSDRKQLLKVTKLGAKTFEQCAGFLRIRNGKNPLDNTAVHPESYIVVKQIAEKSTINLETLNQNTEANQNLTKKLDALNLQQFVSDTIGIPTLKDLIEELKKPGRDPREKFQYAEFQEGINEISDLKEGMKLEGVVTNVVNFGAFVDIGVHQDGLVHVSKLANRFVSNPNEIVKVGEIVKVTVLEVNEKLRRIGLSMVD